MILTQQDLEFWQDLVENLNDLVLSAAPDGRFLYLNRAGRETLGYGVEEIARLSSVDIIHPDSRRDWEAKCRRVVEGESVEVFDAGLLTRDGRIVPVEASVSCRFQDARPLAVQAVLRKSAERNRRHFEEAFRNSQAQLAAESAALERLNTASSRLWRATSLREGLEEVLAATIDLLAADKGTIQLLDEGKKALVIAVQRGFDARYLESFGQTSAGRGTPCGRALSFGARVVVEDIEVDDMDPATLEMARAAGYRAAQSTPLIGSDGAPLGMVSTHFKSPHRPSEAQLRWLDLYVREAAEFIERFRTDQALRESEAFLRMSQHVGRVGSWQWDLRTNQVRWSEAMYSLYGLEPGDFDGTLAGATRTTHPDDIPFVEQCIKRIIELGVGLPIEYRVIKPNGMIAHLWGLGDVTKDEAGNPIQVTGTVVDISARITAEQTLRESEDRFRTLIDKSADAISLVDSTAHFRYVSPAVTAILGYRSDEIVGRSARELIHPEDLDANARIFVKLLKTPGLALSSQFRVRHQDGTWRWLDVTGTNHLTNPILEAIVVNFRDITERIRILDELRAEHLRLRLTLEQAQTILWTTDTELRFTSSAGAGLKALGLEQGQVVGQTLFEFFQTDDPKSAGISDHVRALAGEPVQYEHEVQGHVFDVHVEPMRDERGRIIGCVGISVDVTDRKRAAEQRLQLETQIQHAQKLESLGVLAGGIAHDFNNLLTSMLGYASLALMHMPEESAAFPMLQEIEKAAERAADLTQQMLAYSGKGKFVSHVLRLDTLVNEMSKLLATVVSKKAVLRLDLDPATIEGDATQVRQVVMNLITNASDALEGQNGVISIRTSVKQADTAQLLSPWFPQALPSGPYACVEIEDSGCGMTPDTLARIFEPFFTTKFTGRGLGLAAVLGIVRGHRGCLKVDSTRGTGTLFQVFLPSAQATANEASPPLPPTPQGEGTILIVEDEETIRTFVRNVLEGAGFRVLEACDGHEGLDVFRQSSNEISLVLLDLTMPRMDGVETLRELRRLSLDVPVVVTSGYGEQIVSARFADLKASGFIQKPFRPLDLVMQLCQLLASVQPE